MARRVVASRSTFDMSTLTTDQAQFAAKLQKRLKPRSTADGVVWTLDLRHRDFGHRGRINVYRPGDPGWPNRGATTSSKEEAKEWLYQDGAYVRWLLGEATGDLRGLTTAEAADRYVAHLERRHGKDYNTTVNRTSAVRVHVKPGLGKVPLRALNRRNVRAFLEGLKVTRRVDGQEITVPAARRTRDNVRATLIAIWNYIFPDESCPFHGISLLDADEDDVRVRRERIVAGDVFDLAPGRTLTLAAFEQVLLTAFWLDLWNLERPCLRPTYVPLTAEVIVGMYATAMRVSELARFQWRHLRDEDDALIVPGTKTDKALRAAPLQHAFRPWLERIERQAIARGRRADKDQVWAMRVRGKNSEGSTPGQIIERIGKVLYLAGFKAERQCTHIFRRSHSTVAGSRSDLISPQALKTYLGHEHVYGGATEVYIDRNDLERMIREMLPRHRAYIDLPTPEQILARLPGYTPPMMVGHNSLEEVWAQRKRETVAALREREARAGAAA